MTQSRNISNDAHKIKIDLKKKSILSLIYLPFFIFTHFIFLKKEDHFNNILRRTSYSMYPRP